MKRIHPSAGYPIIFTALAVSLGLAGCRNQSGGMANPFLAPDRVPPPATRAIMPGQAQPYYPGDPLPVMQSNAAPATDSNGLAWTAPGAGSSLAITASAQPEPTLATEAMVAIPADNDSLRFALPAPLEEPPLAPVAQPAMQPPADAQAQGVVQASYTEPAFNSVEPVPTTPWRQPQISQPTLPPPPGIPPIVAQPISPVPVAAMPGSIDVRLRAVTSPPIEILNTPTPRIRMPGEAVPQSASSDGFRPRSSMR
jgi:hypothetical protein